MSLVSITPAAGRIAEIRSAIGGVAKPVIARSNAAQTRGSDPFSATLGAALDADGATSPTTMTPSSMPASSIPVSSLAPGTAAPTISAPVPSAATFVAVDANTPYAALFNEAGQRHGVSPTLLASVAEIESGFDPAAISPVGAGGLMQFMPATAAEMGVDPFEPVSAIDGAARYLARDLARFGRVDLALAAYNAGPGAVAEHNGVPPFTETQQYVQKVLNVLETHS